MKISFILPCYNVDRYIGDCLDSIYSQDIPVESFEVICVNDCSTDRTEDVITCYMRNHTNLVLVNHSINMTSGGARNTGLDRASGDYVWFVDPDDTIGQDVCATLLEKASEKSVDILFFNHEIIDEQGHNVCRNVVFQDTDVYTGQEYIEQFFPKNISELCIVWRCLFRREFIINSSARFPIMRKSQDTVFLWRTLLRSSSVRSIKDIFYCYRDNPYSVAKKGAKAEVIFSERILFGQEVCKIVDGNVLRPIILEDLNAVINWCANANLPALSKLPQRELRLYYYLMKKRSDALKALRPYMSLKSKLLFVHCFGRFAWMRKVALLIKVFA